MKPYDTKVIRPGQSLEEAARLLREGQLVSFPTETVYGLGANALIEDAVRAIFAAKGRPADNPLIVHIWPGYDLDQIVEEIPDSAKKLMEAFWPGPLTMSFRKKDCIPDATTAGLDTVGIRMPDHPVAQSLLRMSGVPVAAPSANSSGRPSPTTAQHVWEDMKGKIPCIVDGGDCKVGLESTFVDMTGPVPMILRPGAITREMLEEVVGRVDVEPSVAKGLAISDEEKPRSPGMKYRHYAPKGQMLLLDGTMEQKAAWIRKALEESDEKTGLLISTELKDMIFRSEPVPEAVHLEELGSHQDPEEMAHRLFGALRRFDEYRCTRIYGEAFSDTGVEMALMNRMRRAAAGQILHLQKGI